MKHAPTPYVHGDNGLIYGQCESECQEAPIVADVVRDRERAAIGVMTDHEAATATYIVTACNNHYQLVAALTSIQECSLPSKNADRKHNALFDCHCLASNALAALKGGAL